MPRTDVKIPTENEHGLTKNHINQTSFIRLYISIICVCMYVCIIVRISYTHVVCKITFCGRFAWTTAVVYRHWRTRKNDNAPIILLLIYYYITVESVKLCHAGRLYCSNCHDGYAYILRRYLLFRYTWFLQPPRSRPFPEKGIV
jgi:hypothetical protein